MGNVETTPTSRRHVGRPQNVSDRRSPPPHGGLSRCIVQSTFRNAHFQRSLRVPRVCKTAAISLPLAAAAVAALS